MLYVNGSRNDMNGSCGEWTFARLRSAYMDAEKVTSADLHRCSCRVSFKTSLPTML